MVGWYRNLQALARQLGRTTSSSSFDKTWNSSSTRITHPFHHYLQHLGISSSRKLLTDSTPIASPLKPLLAISSGKNENQAVVSKPSTVKAVLKKIKQSPKKVNLVAALVRGMRVEDALLQMQITVKRATQAVYQVIHSARANASHNHGLNPDRLIIAEAFVGKGFFQKRISYHAKGKSGVKIKPQCRLTVIVREMTAEEETKMARLRVEKYHRLSKRESRLVPHTLIETSSIWDRRGKRKSNGQGTGETSLAPLY
ncbi:hypothetical protein GIB67_006755 [Kingdonia uniflora]|uniref:Large ribosomal subunit protein uL22c n=1 Tax=Kingdonia uniflora TaxID=39325 RepID=A0A7J7LYX4_9MAGN|nr:hypothetical protein GIB67_006755 [Kingdonia uniflora]